ncbi:MAG: putative glycoside hydrolase [Planctomycetota bacterium]
MTRPIATLVISSVILPVAAASLAAAEAHERARYPPFSWETVPVYLHFHNPVRALTDDELRFAARTSSFICLEKAHAKDALGTTEKGIAFDARRLKKANPRAKVLFYWNSFLNYPFYEASAATRGHPDWVFRDGKGQPLHKKNRWEQYNLLDPGFRAWWASVAGKAVKEYGCDGVFMDAVDQAKRPIWMKKGWGEGKEPLLTEAIVKMMRLARREMGDKALLIYNGIRSLDGADVTRGMGYLPHADGTTVESFTIIRSRSKEAIARDIEAIQKSGRMGKIVVVKGWPDPDFTWLNTEKLKLSPDRLAEEARRKITFTLACFLAAAQEHSYFAYSWGWRAEHGSLIDYPEYHKPLGRPKGDAARNGWVYTRSFEHASVWVDVSKRTAGIDWR